MLESLGGRAGRNRAFCRRIPSGARWSRTAAPFARSAAGRADARRLAPSPGRGLGLGSASPPADVAAERQESRRDSTHAPRLCALAHSAPSWRSPPPRAATSGSGGEGDPASLVPAAANFYLEAAVQPQGDRREDALAAAGKIMRTDDPGGEAARADRQAAGRGGRRPELGEGLRAVARRGRRRVGRNLQADEPSYAVIVASTDADAAKAALGEVREDLRQRPEHRALLRRHRLQGRRGGRRARDRRRLRRDRDRGRVQAHRRDARRGQARRLRPLQGRRRRARGRTGSAISTSTSSRCSTPR